MIAHQSLKKYFKPKPFEYKGRSSIYVFLGIHLFKKYVPTSGDLVYRLWNKKHIEFDSHDREKELLRFEMQTRRWEFRHMIGMVVFLIIVLSLDHVYTMMDYLFVGILFLMVNVYPIILQRHNRIRIVNILHEYNLENPYGHID